MLVKIPMTPFRERQALRWQDAPRRKVAVEPEARNVPVSALNGLLGGHNSVWTTLLTSLFGLAGVGSFAVAVAVFISAVIGQTMTVLPLSVPPAIANTGLTPEVAGLRLRDAIAALVDDAHSLMPGRDIIRQGEVADVVVPNVGISVQTLARQVRAFLGINRSREISGEIYKENGLLFLTLRLDGKYLFSSPHGVNPERPAELFVDAAQASLQATQPYIFTVLVSRRDKALAITMLDAIINAASTEHQERKFAHTLKGNVLHTLGRHDEAMAEHKASIALDPKFAWPHNALGWTLAELVRHDEAID